jgi:hypothetical protein
MQSFQSNGPLFGREELRRDISRYWKSVRNARSALAVVYSQVIADYTKAQDAGKVTGLQAELNELAPDARLASVECLGHPGRFIAHGGYLGGLTAVNPSATDRLNATFEIVPGLANRDFVSFRAVNVPNHYLVHGDFRLRLQPREGSEGFKQNGTFNQVKGLAPAGGVSFEALNYPGFYIHARDGNLFIDKYDGTAKFQKDATFVIAEPKFTLDDPAMSGNRLRFRRQSYVELASTKGLLDLDQGFTAEMWVRFSSSGGQYLIGDESWPGGGERVSRESGWALRSSHSLPGPFNLAFALDKAAWWQLEGPDRQPSKDWEHLAVSKSSDTVQIYWNGKLYASKSCEGLKFVPCPSNLFLGVRPNEPSDRNFDGEFRAFRLSSKATYQRDFTPPKSFEKTADTLILLDFSVGHGNVIPDISGHSHDGRLVGVTWGEISDPP